MKSKLVFFAILFAALAIGACSNQESETANQTDTEIVERVRPAQEGGNSAAYFSYQNELDVADTLVSVSSPVAEMAQVHETYETDDGLMGMREAGELILSPDEVINFKQGGLHIMLMQLKSTLQSGDSVMVELQFAQQGNVKKYLSVSN